MTQLRNKTLKKVIKKLDSTIDIYKKEYSMTKNRDWKKYEEELYNRTLQAILGYEAFIDRTIKKLNLNNKYTTGRPPKINIKQKCMLLLIKQLLDKSNREMSLLTLIIYPFMDLTLSYKAIERLYSDQEVCLIFNKLHTELFNFKVDTSNIQACGDGTGYSLTIRKHYASEAQKLKDELKEVKGQKRKKSSKKKQIFVYSFQLLDIKSRMYISFSTSFKSEREAYDKAINMAKDMGVHISSIRLDRYYSKQMYVKHLQNLFKGIKFYLIPQKNATIKGCISWKNMLKSFIYSPYNYLNQYFQRNQSESAFSEDKRRFGWKIRQKLTKRINIAIFTKIIWHNLFWLGKDS